MLFQTHLSLSLRIRISCVSPIEKKGIRLKSKTVLLSRSESIVTLQTGASSSFLQVVFEPINLHGVNGVYFSKALVTPNVHGEISISVFNLNEVDVKLPGRTPIGNVIRANEIASTKMVILSEVTLWIPLS